MMLECLMHTPLLSLYSVPGALIGVIDNGSDFIFVMTRIKFAF